VIGKSSPLYRRLVVAERLAARVGARLVSQRYGSMAVFFAEVPPGIDPQHCSAALATVLEEIAADGLDQGDVERARNKSLTDFYASVQRLAHRAEVLAVATAYGCGPQPLEAEERYHQAVDLPVLRQWSRRLLDSEQLLSLTVVPQRGSE